jgi:putative N-acetylmannosamine-6-phosphate epimerase
MGSHLVAAMQGADAVITTATGYTRGGKNADDIDTVDERHMLTAGRGVRQRSSHAPTGDTQRAMRG